MSTFLLIILAFFSTLVGIFGDTYDKAKKGWRRLRLTGYLTILIALFSGILLTINALEEQIQKQERTIRANDEIRLILLNCRISVYSGQNRKGNIEDVELELLRQGKSLEESLTYYHDVLPIELQNDLRYLKIKLVDGQKWGPKDHRLAHLREKLESLAKKMNDKSFEETGLIDDNLQNEPIDY
ncbi:hypothetical protein [Flavobacterium collinsii]|jgi:hypothetical protein|uniref:Uncharacterized protein n=1 Tax=Flavobacterium collinsii TaxID=1114861 RepID=A0A9W4X7R1_9FLAO|nr:hypothetical protein [Flavobacterium collinsii]CAI2768618.1 protein of unknown function [Flavobacterium collinsii]